MENLLSKIEKYILYLLVFLFPVIAIPLSPNPFVVSKLEILVFSVLLLLLIRSVKIISAGKLDFSVGNFDLPVLIIVIGTVLSTILETPNKMEALLLPGTATAIIFGTLLYFLINQTKEEDKAKISLALFLSSVFFSLLTLLAFVGLFEKIPQLPAYIKSKNFTPEGGYLPSAIFLTTLLPIGLGLTLSAKEVARKVLLAAGCLVLALALAVSVYNLLPGSPTSPRFPSYATSWNVAVDALKDSPLLGIGVGNYLTAFSRFRPLSYNQTDLWAVKFATATSFYLTLLTEAGMLATAGLILLLLTLYRTVKSDLKEKKLVFWGFAGVANLISLIIISVLLAFLPATTLLIVLIFPLLALNAKTRHTVLNLTTQEVASEVHGAFGQTQKLVASRFPALLITIPIMAASFYSGFRAYRIGLAEYKFKKGLDALAANQASLTYDTMREAIRINPFVDRYHATFSRINLALANSIAQKKDINDQDRTTITTLIQQAITEGKATVSLNPLRAGNWEILAQTYRAIIPLAQGADNFAIQSYRQAIALDPLNPNLRISLGGIYYAKGDFENAVRVFELAVAAKPDHANARYNLAFALREDKKIDRAIQEMTTVLSLIKDKSSQDYQLAKKALEDLQAKKKEQAPTAGGEELTPPQPAPSPVITPPVELPEGSEPPESPLTPTPSPTPTPAS